MDYGRTHGRCRLLNSDGSIHEAPVNSGRSKAHKHDFQLDPRSRHLNPQPPMTALLVLLTGTAISFFTKEPMLEGF